MNKTSYDETVALGVQLCHTGKEPLYQQLAGQIRKLILSGRLAAGQRLASGRALAAQLGVSRVTVVTALEQLVAEGYVEARKGSGHFAASDLPEAVMQAGRSKVSAPPPAPVRPVRHLPVPFQPSGPDMRLFPHRRWARLMQQVWTRPGDELLAGPDAAGWWPLRQQIAGHLRAFRAIECSPEQVFVTPGSVESIEILSQTLFEPGQAIALEEPGYAPVRRAFARAGMKLLPVGIDEAGLKVAALSACRPEPRAVLVTPSRQFPSGMTMPLARRLELLAWAAARGRYVIEDDYDSEYRYRGQPLPALMSLDEQQCVIYLGSFAKIFSASLRLSYFVVPAGLVAAMNRAMEQAGPRASFLAQPVLAQYMASGALAAHIRRMRRIYGLRQQALISAFDMHLAGRLRLWRDTGGMHMVASLEVAGQSDVALAKRAAKSGIVLEPLSSFYHGRARRQGFVLGFAAFDEKQLDAATRQLAELIKQS